MTLMLKHSIKNFYNNVTYIVFLLDNMGDIIWVNHQAKKLLNDKYLRNKKVPFLSLIQEEPRRIQVEHQLQKLLQAKIINYQHESNFFNKQLPFFRMAPHFSPRCLQYKFIVFKY